MQPITTTRTAKAELEIELDSNTAEKEAQSGSRSLNQDLKTRLGQISFINTLPISLPLQKNAVELDCETVYDTPAGLNRLLQSGELDLGAMSSYFFLEHGGFEIFPEISISGKARVGSVLLFSELELPRLAGEIVLVPESSATSIKLMQLLLKDEFGIDVVLKQSSSMQQGAKALLLIGDKALNQDEELQAAGYLRIDLAQWWFKRFALPFVFGVWGARKQWAQDNRKQFHEISDSLKKARELGLGSMLEEVIEEASDKTGLSYDRLRCYYLDELDYELKEEHEMALVLFGDLCRQHGFLA